MILYKVYLPRTAQPSLVAVVQEIRALGLPGLSLTLVAEHEVEVTGQLSEPNQTPHLIGRIRVSDAADDRIHAALTESVASITGGAVIAFELNAPENPVTVGAMWDLLVTFAQFVPGWYWCGQLAKEGFIGKGELIDLDDGAFVVDGPCLSAYAL